MRIMAEFIEGSRVPQAFLLKVYGEREEGINVHYIVRMSLPLPTMDEAICLISKATWIAPPSGKTVIHLQRVWFADLYEWQPQKNAGAVPQPFTGTLEWSKESTLLTSEDGKNWSLFQGDK